MVLILIVTCVVIVCIMIGIYIYATYRNCRHTNTPEEREEILKFVNSLYTEPPSV